MLLMKKIIRSFTLALLFLLIVCLGFEAISKTDFGIGVFKYFLPATISLTIYFSLPRICKSNRLFFSSLFLGTIPIIIQTAVVGTIAIRPLTSTIYWLVAISIILALIPNVINLLFPKIEKYVAYQTFKAFLACVCLLFPALVGTFFFAYFLVSNSVLSADALLAIAQTNSSEALAYLKENISFNTAFFLSLAFLLILFLLATLTKSIVKQGSRNELPSKHAHQHTQHRTVVKNCICFCGVSIILMPLITVVVSGALVVKTKDNLITKPFIGFSDGLKSYEDFKIASQEREKKFGALSIQEKGFKGLYILVIGESQNRNHMSAFGYKKDTTPWLSQIKNSPNSVLFSNAFSNHTHTVPALTFALTSKSQYNDVLLQNCPSLIELANASGFETFWMSNQVKLSAWDTPVSLIASMSNHQVFINTSGHEDASTTYFDEELINRLKQLKTKNDRVLVVLHLMGNHTVYEERYPSSFNKFGTSKIDKYDNSILYNDAVVKGIYEWAKRQPNFMSLIYVSDHSEGVDRGVSHDSSQFDWDLTEIPFWMIFSNKYVEEHPVIVKNLKRNEDKPFTNDMLFDTMSSVLGIASNYKDDKNDISSDSYSKTLNELKTLHGTKSFRERK